MHDETRQHEGTRGISHAGTFIATQWDVHGRHYSADTDYLARRRAEFHEIRTFAAWLSAPVAFLIIMLIVTVG